MTTLYALVLTTFMAQGSMIDEVSVVDTELTYEACTTAVTSNQPIVYLSPATMIAELGCWTMDELERVEAQD